MGIWCCVMENGQGCVKSTAYFFLFVLTSFLVDVDFQKLWLDF
jgi:hypothetical protein